MTLAELIAAVQAAATLAPEVTPLVEQVVDALKGKQVDDAAVKHAVDNARAQANADVEKLDADHALVVAETDAAVASRKGA